MALSFTETGQGPAVVLLHPVGLSSEFWPGVVEPLAERFTVIAVDLGGHGRSPDVARPGRFADRLAEVVELVEPRAPVALVGASFGGMLAMHVAATRPDLVSALVLSAAPPAIPEEGRAPVLERGRTAEAGGMEAVLQDTLTRWFTPGFQDDPLVARVAERLRANAPSNWAGTWEAVSEHDALDRLGDIRCPTLVIAGEADAATPLAAKRRLAEGIPGATLEIIEGAPHMIHLERPGEFVALVDGFLRRSL